MKYIVTGGSGFLGTKLLRALKNAGHQVVNIDIKDSKEFPTIIADVRDRELMKRYISNADAVFHLASLIEAGESVIEPFKFVDYNINGTLSVLEAMRLNGIKTFLFSSSAAVYGEPINIPIKEDDRTMPINPYGMTKLAMEALLSSYVKAHGFTGVALRYFNLYGPEEHHEPETHALPRFIKQIYSGDKVTVYGNGQHLRDYIHVDDIVAAHLMAVDYALKNTNKYHYFNLSTEKPTSVKEVVELAEKFLNKKADIAWMPERAGDPLVLYADASKARNELNWSAKVDLESGIKETVAYFLNLWEK